MCQIYYLFDEFIVKAYIDFYLNTVGHISRVYSNKVWNRNLVNKRDSRWLRF